MEHKENSFFMDNPIFSLDNLTITRKRDGGVREIGYICSLKPKYA